MPVLPRLCGSAAVFPRAASVSRVFVDVEPEVAAVVEIDTDEDDASPAEQETRS